MDIIKIPKKKKGEFREICVPSLDEKIKYRSYLSSLNEKTGKLCDKDIVQGFCQSKSPVTNAKKHINRRYTLRFDLSNFFDTVTPAHLKGKIKEEEIKELMPDNRAYQGLPTSPALANLAAIEMDKSIKRKIENREIIYTRYADDLTFSFDNYENVAFLKLIIPEIVNRCNFKINTAKTWLQDSKFGNRIITGIAVNDTGIIAGRRVRRKLRAAIHQKNILSCKGLSEWIKLKEPKPQKINYKINREDFRNLLAGWKLKSVNPYLFPYKGEDEDLGDNIIISGDPILLIGLSNFVTNWKSCMHHPNGLRHRGALFWPFIQGTRIAGLFSEDTMTINNFARRKMKARTLIHETLNGKFYYDRIYGENDRAIGVLRIRLEERGVNRLNTAEKSSVIKGFAPKKLSRPYFDNLMAVSSFGPKEKACWTLIKK